MLKIIENTRIRILENIRDVRTLSKRGDIRETTLNISYLGRYSDRTSWPFRTTNAKSRAKSNSANTRVKIAALLA